MRVSAFHALSLLAATLTGGGGIASAQTNPAPAAAPVAARQLGMVRTGVADAELDVVSEAPAKKR